MFETLNPKDLRGPSSAVLRDSTSSRPKLWVVEEGGVRAVVKDFGVHRFAVRNTMGRFLVWRESKAYRRLKGVSGVPVLYRVVGGTALVVEWIPGRSVEKLEREMTLPESFFEALQQLIERIHKRGVAHCDLKRAANILLGDDGLPYLVDWGAAVSKSEFGLYPFGLIYRRLLLDDRRAVTKLKLRHLPERVAPDDRARYAHRSRAERAIRAVRNRLRRLGQRVA